MDMLLQNRRALIHPLMFVPTTVKSQAFLSSHSWSPSQGMSRHNRDLYVHGRRKRSGWASWLHVGPGRLSSLPLSSTVLTDGAYTFVWGRRHPLSGEWSPWLSTKVWGLLNLQYFRAAGKHASQTCKLKVPGSTWGSCV